ncbi:gamma-glutamyl-gamma-aminobutyraldehyde dehydrogenase [Aliidongia dinghuensis]|uniref:Gamma-glutamyl-gamma-aminobutyraldehyde dehydrogenase n=1 Tax=Aliidongia dinghuensis TaxID=1867774 RepID=A0A8J3E6B7_9PROT|nr:aldehyde dehydrogenase [Aliidongia dinghuensis]GGF43039.1 gamma-glutamyl-gamma-aminobutyraldehyde dehydrogenase [Aliidongia dinghuensis]
MSASPDYSSAATVRAALLPSQAFIGGRSVSALSGETLPCIFPGDGKLLGHVAACDTADVDLAVNAARKAFEAGHWSRMAPQDRRKILLRFSELILEHRDELATLETLNVGKPFLNALNGDIPSAASCIAWFGEAIDKMYGEVGPTPADLTAVLTREPLGVVAAVVPWNYPLSMAAWKLGPSLAAGNSVILKPAEQSPYTALRIASLAMEAGLPEGVLNVVSGYGATAGQALGRHMDVDCVTFTGSTEVGKLFMRYAGESNAKRVSLELGGKSPQLVLADSDLDAAAAGVAAGIFANAGQVCNAGSRLIVERRVKDELLERIAKLAGALKIGDPFDPSTRLGPLVSKEQHDRVLGYIDAGLSEGASLLVGGARPAEQSSGYFIEPTIFDGVRNDMKIAQEEIFGPVLSTITVDGFEEGIAVANDTIYGLAAGVWTNDIRKAQRAAKAIRAGVVWVNCFDRGNMAVPFGGFKQSGHGRDKSLHAIEKYTDWKATWYAC